MENITGVLIYGVLAILFIGLGIPLAYRKVKRNHIYGYRISSYVMNYDDIWYAVNEMGGKHLVIIGCILAVIVIYAAFFMGHPEIQRSLFRLAVVYILLGIAFSWWRTLSLTYKMAKDKGLKK